MTTKTKTTLAALASIALVPAAYAAPMVGEAVGTSIQDIASNLESAGYEVLEVEKDDDEFEAEVLIDGEVYEIEISAEDGTITEVELEEDDEDDDDDDDDDMDNMSESSN